MPAATDPSKTCDRNSVDRREPRKDLGDLKRANEPGPDNSLGVQTRHHCVLEPYRSAVGTQSAGDEVEKRGLAGSVRTNDSGDRALRNIEVDPVDGGEVAEALSEIPNGKHGAHTLFSTTVIGARVAASRRPAVRPRSRRPRGPSGRNRINKITIMPSTSGQYSVHDPMASLSATKNTAPKSARKRSLGRRGAS